MIQTLNELYEMGIDYIDIVGIPNEVQDNIVIAYNKDYMSKELIEGIDEAIDDFIDSEEQKKNIKLSDDDLNQII